jgi:Uma2 family endonuclease
MASTITTPERSAAAIRMSWEEFLNHDFEGIAEWVDGEVRIDMSVTEAHSRMVGFLIELLRAFCEATGAGVVRHEPHLVRLQPGGRGRAPDVLLLLEEHRDRLGEQFIDGPADLVIEVVSKESASRDRDEKFREYEAGGVPEYWILDPRAGFERADFFVLAPDPVRPGRSAFRPVPIASDGTYQSAVVPELRITVAWLWRDDAKALKCLAEMIGRERVLTLLD